MNDHDAHALENPLAAGGEPPVFRVTVTYYCKGCGRANFVEGLSRGGPRQVLRPCDHCGLTQRPPRRTRRCYPPPPGLDRASSYELPRIFPGLCFGRVLGMLLGVVLTTAFLVSPVNKQISEKLEKDRQGKSPAAEGAPRPETVQR